MNQKDNKSTIHVMNTAYTCFLSRFYQRAELVGYISTIVNFHLSLTRLTFFYNLIHKVIYARALCFDRMFLRGLMMWHWEHPDACCCLHMVRQQETIEVKRLRAVLYV